MAKANIALSAKRMKVFFSLRSGVTQGCSLLAVLFNIVLEFLARIFRQKKE